MTKIESMSKYLQPYTYQFHLLLTVNPCFREQPSHFDDIICTVSLPAFLCQPDGNSFPNLTNNWYSTHRVKQKMLKDTLQINNVNIIYNKPKTKTLFLFQAVNMFNSALKLDI